MGGHRGTPVAADPSLPEHLFVKIGEQIVLPSWEMTPCFRVSDVCGLIDLNTVNAFEISVSCGKHRNSIAPHAGNNY